MQGLHVMMLRGALLEHPSAPVHAARVKAAVKAYPQVLCCLAAVQLSDRVG